MSIVKYELGCDVSMKIDDKDDRRFNTSNILFVQENIYKFGLNLYKKVKYYYKHIESTEPRDISIGDFSYSSIAHR